MRNRHQNPESSPLKDEPEDAITTKEIAEFKKNGVDGLPIVPGSMLARNAKFLEGDTSFLNGILDGVSIGLIIPFEGPWKGTDIRAWKPVKGLTSAWELAHIPSRAWSSLPYRAFVCL
jgi:hypothetical protein